MHVPGFVLGVEGVGTTLFATTNWILMFMRAHEATVAAYLAIDHEGGNGGLSDTPAELAAVSPEPNQPEHDALQPTRTVDLVLADLASVPVELGRLIEDSTDEDLAQPAQDGGWGLVEILPHFRDWELIIAERVTEVLTAEEPALEEYDDSLWAIEHEYREQDPRATFAEFAALRESLVERLRTLDAEQWSRLGILPKRGRITLHWMMDNVCDHDAKHVVQARDVLA